MPPLDEQNCLWHEAAVGVNEVQRGEAARGALHAQLAIKAHPAAHLLEYVAAFPSIIASSKPLPCAALLPANAKAIGKSDP